MDGPHAFEEVKKQIELLKQQVENEKKEISEGQQKFSNLVNSFSQKAPSSSVIHTLFKDEPEGLVFSKHEEKRKQLAEQRRAEYNAYLEKKEAEQFLKQKVGKEKKDVAPKSLLESVDYERILAKRKEEEAQFRNVNHADFLSDTLPIANEDTMEPDSNGVRTLNNVPLSTRNNSVTVSSVNTPRSTNGFDGINHKFPLVDEKKSSVSLQKENSLTLEQRIAKQLEEQRHQMLLEFEKELRKNSIMKEEIQSMKSTNSVQSSPKRMKPRSEGFPSQGLTGGGGDPVRDSFGNMLTLRGQRKASLSDGGSILSFPSMQQKPIKDRMAMYREELQKQIEEKKRMEEIEKAKAREQEEKFARRVEEQRLKELEEYENEMRKNNKIKEEFQRQQERLKKLQEFQKRDAEARKRKVVELKSPPPERPQLPVAEERSISPPIPAVRAKVLLEKAVDLNPEGLRPETPLSSLAEIRRRIREEQQKTKKQQKNSYEVMNRRTVQELSEEDEDEALLRTSANSNHRT